MPQGRLHVGVSGWRYAPWRGNFYPSELPQRLELWYLSRVFPTVEINGSFYSMQRPSYFKDWYDATPPGFVFAVKGPRFITHMKKLREVRTPLANFFASGVFNLREKLGPILWQFPPNFRFDPERLQSFFELLPGDLAAASKLARAHDGRLKTRAVLQFGRNRTLRYAMEIRHDSFANKGFIKLLRKYGIALVVAETANKWPLLFDVSADFMYLRLHGDKELYRSGYSAGALDRWATRVRAWREGAMPKESLIATAPKKPTRRDVYVYFDNTDVKLRAPVDAQTLMRKLGMKPGRPVWKAAGS